MVNYRESRKGTKKRPGDCLYIGNDKGKKNILKGNKNVIKKKTACVVQHHGSQERWFKNKAVVNIVQCCRDIKENQCYLTQLTL